MASEKQTFRAKWTEFLTNLFISLLVEEVKKRNRISSTYNKAGWNNIRVEFIKQTGFQYSILQLKNKVNKLRKQYESFKKLLSQSGFGWDSVTKTVVVDDPSIWGSHIKDNIEWTKFKNDGFSQYPELCIIFCDTYASGDHAMGNAEDLMVLEEGDNGGGNAEDFNEHHIDKRVFTSNNVATPVYDKPKLDMIPNTKRRRKSNSFGVADACKAIQDPIKLRTSRSTSDSVTSKVTPPPVDPFLVSALIDVLVSMHELEQDLYNKAVERACISDTWRVAFIKSPPERRYGLLRYL